MGTKVTGLDIGHHAIRVVSLDVSFRNVQVLDVRIEPVIEPGPERNEAHTPVAGHAAADAEGEAGGVVGEDIAEAPPVLEKEEPAPEAPAGMLAGEHLSPGTVAALERLRAQGVLQADRVHCTLPLKQGYLTRLAFPFTGRREIESVLRPQLEGQLPLEVDDLLVDFTRGAKSVEGGQLVFSTAVLPRTIENCLQQLRDVDIDPRIVELSPFPLLAAWRRRRDPAAAPCTALVDIGATTTSVLVLRDNQLEYARTFRGGGEGVTEALQEAFSLDEELAREGKHREGSVAEAGLLEPGTAEAEGAQDTALIVQACREGLQPMLRQLRRSLQAHASEAATPIEAVQLTGAGVSLKGMEEYLSEQLGVPVSRFALEDSMRAEHTLLDTRGHEFSGALGLALRAVTEHGGSEFNLRRDAFSFRGGYAFLLNRIPALAAGAVAVMLAGALIVAGSFAQASAERRHLEDALESATAEVFGSPLLVPDRIRSRLTEGGGRSFMPERSAMDVFFDISALVGQLQSEGVPVEARNIEVDLSRRLFDIRGVADSAEAVDRLETRMGRVECLHTIQRGTLQQSRQGDGFDFGIQGAASCTRASGEREGR